MGKKTGRIMKAKKKASKKSKNAKSKIHEKKQEMITYQLQETVESYNDACNSSNFDYIPQTKSNVQTSPEKDSSLIQSSTNNCNKDIAYNECYRCKHLLEISSNLPRPFEQRKGISTIIGQCEADLNFIQAIIWLKSTIAYTSQIPIDELWHNIFTKRWNTRDKCNYAEETRINDVERQGSSVNKDLSVYKKTAVKNISKSPNLFNLSDESENLENELIGFLNTPVFLTQKSYTVYQTEDGKNEKLSSAFDIPPETNFRAESFKNQRDMFDDELEHQNECIENIFFSQKEYANDRDEYHFSPILSHQNLIDSQYDLADQVLTQLSQTSIFQNDDARHWNQENASNSQADSLLFSNVHNDDDNFNTDIEFQIDDNDIDTQIENNDTIIKNVEHDSDYSTSHMFNNSTLKSPDDNRRELGTDTEPRYELRNRKRKHKVISSPSIKRSKRRSNISNKHSPPKRQSKEHKSERTKNLFKEKERSKKKIISANWLNFILHSLNLEGIIFESFKVILPTLCDERTAEEYATHGCWKGTLEKEAVDAMLTLSDICRMEKKPNIYRKEIVTAVHKTLDEMMTCVQLNKTFVWNYRVQIILEMCNSLSICVAIIDHLTAKLKLFHCTLSEIMRSRPSNQLNFSITINQLYFIFYALNIAVQKYRTVISNRRARPMEEVILHEADLWKARYIDEELEDAGLNLNTAEKQWISTLESFKNVAPFAEKAISLLRILLL